MIDESKAETEFVNEIFSTVVRNSTKTLTEALDNIESKSEPENKDIINKSKGDEEINENQNLEMKPNEDSPKLPIQRKRTSLLEDETQDNFNRDLVGGFIEDVLNHAVTQSKQPDYVDHFPNDIQGHDFSKMENETDLTQNKMKITRKYTSKVSMDFIAEENAAEKDVSHNESLSKLDEVNAKLQENEEQLVNDISVMNDSADVKSSKEENEIEKQGDPNQDEEIKKRNEVLEDYIKSLDDPNKNEENKEYDEFIEFDQKNFNQKPNEGNDDLISKEENNFDNDHENNLNNSKEAEIKSTGLISKASKVKINSQTFNKEDKNNSNLKAHKTFPLEAKNSDQSIREGKKGFIKKATILIPEGMSEDQNQKPIKDFKTQKTYKDTFILENTSKQENIPAVQPSPKYNNALLYKKQNEVLKARSSQDNTCSPMKQSRIKFDFDELKKITKETTTQRKKTADILGTKRKIRFSIKPMDEQSASKKRIFTTRNNPKLEERKKAFLQL